MMVLSDIISYERLLWHFEHDQDYIIDETLFYFDDEPEFERTHYIGCIRKYKKPYWAGYCDIKDGAEFLTAQELFTAKIYNGKSIKDRWSHLVLVEIGGISAGEWLEFHEKNTN